MSKPSVFEVMEYLQTSRHPRAIWWRFKWGFRSGLRQRLANCASIFCRGRARVWRKRLAWPGALMVDDSGPGRLDSNWIGAVRLGLRGEEWPRGNDGRPMTPVVQMNIAESPFVPEALRGVRLLTMFVSAPNDEYETISLPDWSIHEPPHGDGWCVRTYRAADDLVEIHPPSGTRLPSPKPMRWEHLAGDTPDFLTDVCDAMWATRIAYGYKRRRAGTRLGGWPIFIQGAWPWRPWCKQPEAPMYLFQVHGGDGFSWCDAGAASVGIHDDGRWVITWQCY